MGENKFVIAIWAGVSSNDALCSPARTKRLLRRLLFKYQLCLRYTYTVFNIIFL
jgi:hypothetical protein